MLSKHSSSEKKKVKSVHSPTKQQINDKRNDCKLGLDYTISRFLSDITNHPALRGHERRGDNQVHIHYAMQSMLACINYALT